MKKMVKRLINAARKAAAGFAAASLLFGAAHSAEAKQVKSEEVTHAGHHKEQKLNENLSLDDYLKAQGIKPTHKYKAELAEEFNLCYSPFRKDRKCNAGTNALLLERLKKSDSLKKDLDVDKKADQYDQKKSPDDSPPPVKAITAEAVTSTPQVPPSQEASPTPLPTAEPTTTPQFSPSASPSISPSPVITPKPVPTIAQRKHSEIISSYSYPVTPELTTKKGSWFWWIIFGIIITVICLVMCAYYFFRSRNHIARAYGYSDEEDDRPLLIMPDTVVPAQNPKGNPQQRLRIMRENRFRMNDRHLSMPQVEGTTTLEELADLLSRHEFLRTPQSTFKTKQLFDQVAEAFLKLEEILTLKLKQENASLAVGELAAMLKLVLPRTHFNRHAVKIAESQLKEKAELASTK